MYYCTIEVIQGGENMKWNIDNNKPIHSQLVEQLKSKIISGEIEIGSKLEPVRVMAQEAEVNPNTMQKALVELENQGLAYSKRTTGRFVTEDFEIVKNMREEVAIQSIKELQETLKKLGYSNAEIIELIKQNLRSEINE